MMLHDFITFSEFISLFVQNTVSTVWNKCVDLCKQQQDTLYFIPYHLISYSV